MPFQADWLAGAPGDLEVGELLAFLVDEDDSGFIGGDGQDHVEVSIAPSRRERTFTLREGKVGVKEQRHI